MAPPPGRVGRRQAGGLAAVLAGCVLLPATPLRAVGTPALRGGADEVSQVLVFDAGSSGTRIHVFNLRRGGPADPVPIVDLSVRGQQTKKVKPGLSTFAEKEDIDGAAANLRELLDFARQYVPVDRRAETPLVLKATAGLRGVKYQLVQEVLDIVQKTLAESGFLFKPEWAAVIRGREEAGLAWIAANYLQGTFNGTAAEVGVVEMGGASTQVTFTVGNRQQLDPHDEWKFYTRQGRLYRLYAHSYQGFGLDAARESVASLAAAGENGDPCYPKGHEFSGGRQTVVGTGDQAKCADITARQFIEASRAGPGKYVNEVAVSEGMTFAATEHWFYQQQDAGLKLEGVAVTAGSLRADAQRICSRPGGSGSGLDPKVANTCFGLTFLGEFIGALRSVERGASVKVTRQIGGADVDWSLGAAIVQQLERESLVGEMPPTPDAGPVTLGWAASAAVSIKEALRWVFASSPWWERSCS